MQYGAQNHLLYYCKDRPSSNYVCIHFLCTCMYIHICTYVLYCIYVTTVKVQTSLLTVLLPLAAQCMYLTGPGKTSHVCTLIVQKYWFLFIWAIYFGVFGRNRLETPQEMYVMYANSLSSREVMYNW